MLFRSTLYRKEILLPVSRSSVSEFLNLEFEQTTNECEIIEGTEEHQILKSITTIAPFIYAGEKICDNTINTCKFLANLKFKIINVYDENNNHKGMFFSKDFAEKAWILQLSKSNKIREFLELNESLIKISV